MGTSETWPNFFIVGAPKAATTSLYEYLSKVPGVYMSPRKEPHYFSEESIPRWSPLRPIRDKTKYLRLFRNSGTAVAIGEASTSYLGAPGAAENILREIPKARIIIALRDPVERMHSSYWMQYRLGNTNVDFDSCVRSLLKGDNQIVFPDYKLSVGLYSKPVEKYIQLFGKGNVKIIYFEEFVRQPYLILAELTTFLGVDPIPEAGGDFKKYNSFGLPRGPIAQWIMRGNVFIEFLKRVTPRKAKDIVRRRVLVKEIKKPLMSAETRAILQKFYEDDGVRLRNILGKDLPWPTQGA